MRYTAGVIATLVLIVICRGLSRFMENAEEEVPHERIVFQPTDFEHTRQAIERELASAEAAAGSLALTREKAESELEAAREYHEIARKSVSAFRSAFQDAESRGSYPVVIEGTSLMREDLLARAHLSLEVQESSAGFLPPYLEVLDSIATLEEKVHEQIATARMMTDYLRNDGTRREFERDRSRLTLLARQVETLANHGHQIQSQIDQPVPKLGQMIQTMSIAKSEPESDARLLEFLRSRTPQEPLKKD